jgi:hypothetical protein
MFYEPADHPLELARIARGGSMETKARLSSCDSQSLKKLIAALIVASAVSACTGGAGLNMPMEPVDHGCHHGDGTDLGGEGGSGCSWRRVVRA